MLEGQDVLASLLAASSRTWRLTDGRGALARGTASGAATRRGHALLAAPLAGPRAELPAVSLLRFDDRITPPGGSALELTPAFLMASRPGTTRELTARAGASGVLESFTAEPWPRWRWRGDGWCVEREYRVIEGHAALFASWRLLEGGPLKLHVAPLLVARALEGLQQETPEFRGLVNGIPGRVRCLTVEGYAPLTLWHGGAFMPARAWQRGIAYPFDSAGREALLAPDAGAAMASEDAFLPGWVQSTLHEPGAALHLVASTEEQLFRALATEHRLGTPPARTLADCLGMLDLAAGERIGAWTHQAQAGATRTQRQALAAHAGVTASPETAPSLAAEFAPVTAALATRLHGSLHERADRTSVLTDPALGLERGREALRVAAGLITLRAFAPARDLARGYLAYLDEGLAPDAFDATGMPVYGTPETSLWLVHVADLIARRDATSEATQSLFKDGGFQALESVLHHLRSGSRYGVRCDREGFLWAGEGADACARADWNALWYHALVAMSALAKQAGRRESSAFYLAWARELQRAYAERFWDAAAGCLFERITGDGVARGLAPTQLLAVSLPPMLLSPEHAATLTRTVTRELFTSRGLRPAPGDGTADPSWLGLWASAVLRAEGREVVTGDRVRGALATFVRRGEGDARELCAAGAADLLRAWVEELDHRTAESLETA